MEMYKLASVALIAVAYLLVASGELVIKEKKLPCERLSNNVVPTGYQLELQFPSFEAQTFNGHVNISLRFPNKVSESNSDAYRQLVKGLLGETCKFVSSSSTIILHADPSIELLSVDVVTTSSGWGFFGKGRKTRAVISIGRDTEKQLIAIKFKKGLHASTSGQLSIGFTSKFSENKRGIYVSKFKDGHTVYKHVVSQFQPTDARRVFPVFDEPRFKVPFQVRLVHPAGLTALSNTEVESAKPAGDVPLYSARQLTRTTFKRTPPMAVHMVAFTVGQFDEPLEIEAKSTVTDKTYKVRVFTEPGKRESGRFALEVAQGALEHFERYIDYEFPLDKFDLVAISDHDQDNTEHWGLAFIRDPLIWADDETKPDSRISIAINVAHVCVHQWFANLITVAWWTDLWITEGVASSFAFVLVRELYPQFQSEYFVRLATLSGVMQKDAPGTQHSLKPTLDEFRTSEHIYSVFDNVGFMKSAALATMINKWLAKDKPDWYRDALRALVNKCAYQSVTRDDYMEALRDSVLSKFRSEQGTLIRNLAKLIDGFGSIRGVPLVNVQLVGDTLSIDLELMHKARKEIEHELLPPTQEIRVYDEFFIEHGDPKTNEMMRQLTDSPMDSFTSTCKRTLVDDKIQYVKMSPNPDINTYFRTRYSKRLYGALSEPISRRQLSAMDRLQLLDDANALVQAGLISSDTFKQLVDSFANEDNGAVLIELMLAQKTLASQGLSSPSSKLIVGVFEKNGFAVTGKETFLEQRSRQVILKALIVQGNQQVIEAALRAFDEAEGNVALFLREPVYAAVALAGTEAQVKQLGDKLTTTKSYEEKIRLATALSMSADEKVLRNLWAWLENLSGLSEATIQPFVVIIKSKL